MGAKFEDLTPAERAIRSLNGKIGAHESWARTRDRSQRTAKARAAAFDRFMTEVDPNNELSYEDRVVAANHAQHAHMMRMVNARRSKRAS